MWLTHLCCQLTEKPVWGENEGGGRGGGDKGGAFHCLNAYTRKMFVGVRDCEGVYVCVCVCMHMVVCSEPKTEQRPGQTEWERRKVTKGDRRDSNTRQRTPLRQGLSGTGRVPDFWSSNIHHHHSSPFCRGRQTSDGQLQVNPKWDQFAQRYLLIML